MTWARMRTLVVLAALAALVSAVVRAARGPAAPAFAGHPSADPIRLMSVPAAAEAEPEPTSPPEQAPTPEQAAPPTEAPSGTGAPFAHPVEGGCPEGYPVK